jgi:hypothetical protein
VPIHDVVDKEQVLGDEVLEAAFLSWYQMVDSQWSIVHRHWLFKVQSSRLAGASNLEH